MITPRDLVSSTRHRDYIDFDPCLENAVPSNCSRVFTLHLFTCTSCMSLIHSRISWNVWSVCHSNRNRKLIADTPSCFEARRDCRGFACFESFVKKKRKYNRHSVADKRTKKKKMHGRASSLFAECRMLLLLLIISRSFLFYSSRYYKVLLKTCQQYELSI